jgi:SAM-dependent methyltransferase
VTAVDISPAALERAASRAAAAGENAADRITWQQADILAWTPPPEQCDQVSAHSVLAGHWIIDCESFDKATEIAAELSKRPGPAYASASVIDLRPIAESRNALDI